MRRHGARQLTGTSTDSTAPRLSLRLTAQATRAAPVIKQPKPYSGCHTWNRIPHPFRCYLRRETVPRDTGTLKETHFGGSLQNPHPSFGLTPSCTRLLPLLKDCFTARKEKGKDYNNNLHATLLGMGFFWEVTISIIRLCTVKSWR